MSNCNITLYWAVPEKIWEKEILSLTWSASVLNFYWNKILVDIWLFQGWEWSDLYNKENIKFIDDLDAVFITHSHMDHIWRVPLLHKLGYRWPIYMTQATKDITYEMLLDCLKIQEWDAIIRERKNKTLRSRLEKSLEIRDELVLELKSKKKLEQNKENDLNELNAYLNFYNIKWEEDINFVIDRLKETLFSKDDIDGVMWLIKTVEHNEEMNFDPKKISSINYNREDQDLLNNFPRCIAEWYSSKIEVDKDSELRKLKKIWVKDLINEVKKLLSNKSLRYQDINKTLSKKLHEAYTFCNIEYPAYINWSKWVHKNDSNQYKGKFKEYSKLLDFYDIKVRDNIEELFENTKSFIEDLKNKSPDKIIDNWFHNATNNWIDNTIDILKKLIEIFNLELPFDTKDIDKALDNTIVLNKKNRNRNNVSIMFSDAAHLVWSSSVTLTTSLIKSKVTDVLNRRWEAISVFFSWDMWRINDNRLWRPAIPPKPVDYLQIESTYGWRNHRNREDSVKELIDSIERSEWNVLISVFSQQRLQEVLLTILEEKEKRGSEFLDYEILIDAPLGEKVLDKYLKYKPEIYWLLGNWLENWLFRFLEMNEWSFIYSEENIDKKHIILASSWMMDWWAIMNHLPNILLDPKATLLAPCYLSRWTLWNEIVWWEKTSVKINWIPYEINCNKKFIDWFSAHIWHDEILQYIRESIIEWKFKSWSTIALTHWNKEWQLELKNDLENILLELNRTDIIITIPWIFDEFDIVSKRINEVEKEDDKLTSLEENDTKLTSAKETGKKLSVKKEISKKPHSLEKLTYKKPIVPKIVLELEKKEEKIELEKIPQVIIEEQARNKKEIDQIKLKLDIISRRKKTFEEEYLNSLLGKSLTQEVDDINNQVLKFSTLQKKMFYDDISYKLTKNRAIDDLISNIWSKITSIWLIKDNLINFYETSKFEISLKHELSLELNKWKISLEKFEKERIELKTKLNNLINSDTEKNDEYRHNISDLKKRIRWKNNKIKLLKNSIKFLKIDLSNINNELIWLLPQEYLGEFESIYKNLPDEYTEILGVQISDFCNKVIDKYGENIDNALNEKKSHISLNYQMASQHFWWLNLYKDFYNIESKQIDLVKLQKLIDKEFFKTEELLYINTQLSIIKSSDSWKRAIKYAMKNLVSYFRKKRDENNNVWIDFELSLEKLNEKYLLILWEIFEEKYFEQEVKDKFNVYSFIKSKQSLVDYISRKFIIQNLKGISNNLDKFSEQEDQIDYLVNILDWIENSNNLSKSVGELDDINFWIYCTKKEIDEVLNWL